MRHPKFKPLNSFVSGPWVKWAKISRKRLFRRCGRGQRPGPARRLERGIGIKRLRPVDAVVGILGDKPPVEERPAFPERLIGHGQILADVRLTAETRHLRDKRLVTRADTRLRVEPRRRAAQSRDSVLQRSLVRAVFPAGCRLRQLRKGFRNLERLWRHDREFLGRARRIAQLAQVCVTIDRILTRTACGQRHQCQYQKCARHHWVCPPPYSPHTCFNASGRARHEAFLPEENNASPMAPKNTEISATLNAYGLSMPQQDMFRKSATAP